MRAKKLDGDSRTRSVRGTKLQKEDRDIEDLKLGHPRPRPAGEEEEQEQDLRRKNKTNTYRGRRITTARPAGTRRTKRKKEHQQNLQEKKKNKNNICKGRKRPAWEDEKQALHGKKNKIYRERRRRRNQEQ